MLATQTEVSDGTLNIVNVGIEFFEQDDISVAINQGLPLEVGTDYQWATATSIQFLNTTLTPSGLVPLGGVVLLRRNTKNDEMYNVFDGGAPFNRLALDENYEQLLMLSQEFAEGLGIDGLQNNLDMHGYRVTHLGDAIDDTDAMPKGQADATFVNVSGDTMTGGLNMSGSKVSGLAGPTASTDAVRLMDLEAEEAARQAADAVLQAQISGGTPPLASPFSPVSWHPQVIASSLVIPDNMNAWSFGPQLTIADGQSVTIGTGSFWTIANGATTQEGPLVAELPANIDMGELP